MPESVHYEERLAAAAETIARHQEQERLAREQRDRLVVDAVDAGNSWSTVARWARISNGQIHRVLARGSSAA